MSQESSTNTPNIIVFGQTGSGKSSLINMLAREDVAKVSSEVWGCTPAAKGYDLVKQDKTYRFWDTPGLNEGEEGNVPAQKAINSLFELVKTINVSLIIYCVRGGRLTDIVRVNCDLFCRIICEGKVPIVLVVTGLEQEDNMDQWWTRFEKDVRRLDLAFKEHACVTTIKGRNDLYSKEYEQSANKVWRLVESCCSSTPWISTPKWLDEVPKRMAAYMAEYNACTGKERKVLDWHRPVSFVHNVILFGESGSGKSSLVNMILGQDIAKVSSSPRGCTFENQCYETRIGDIPYCIYDTAGLNEGDRGRVPHWKAIKGLYTLIRQLDGVSLLVFCMRGRIRDNTYANWLFFFDAICGQKVPTIAVVTGCEQEENSEEAEAQLTIAFKKYSMLPKEVAGLVSIPGKNNEYEEKYKRSQQRLRGLIVKYHREKPWSEEKDKWFAQLYERTYELQICIFAKSRLQFVEGIRGAFEEFKKNSNLEEGDIDTITKGLIEAEETVLKKMKKLRHDLN